jgi:hypothetical protein
MSPEDVLANLISLRETLNLNTHGQTLDYTPASVAAIAASEPLLLVQHPAATAAAVQQLQVRIIPCPRALLAPFRCVPNDFVGALFIPEGW